jgi:hypothetical protein
MYALRVKKLQENRGKTQSFILRLLFQRKANRRAVLGQALDIND